MTEISGCMQRAVTCMMIKEYEQDNSYGPSIRTSPNRITSAHSSSVVPGHRLLAFKTNLGMFEFLNERPKRLSAFNTFMEGHRADRIPWFQYYPVDNSLGDGTQNEKAVLLVNIGGGRGHDLEAFKSAFPHQRGRLVLQDLPETIDDIDHLALGVESVKHDFFPTQPIQGSMTSTTSRMNSS